MNVKFHKITSYPWNFQNFTFVFTILVKFDILFLRLPWEIFFGVITDDWLHLKPLKNVKRNAIFFKLFPVQGFCPLKIKITQFPGAVLICTSLTQPHLWFIKYFSIMESRHLVNLSVQNALDCIREFQSQKFS